MILLSCLQLYFLFSPPVAAAAMEIRQFLAVLNSCHLSSTAVRTTYYSPFVCEKLIHARRSFEEVAAGVTKKYEKID